ncbi:phosphonate ABC transporter, permease protein PhnE [Ruania halotolerans]|uniref:phosphonate ABC transporter, permease protein PhnE n=1 Tax=Ruania halotolerans TaxID=2897773 RepID=UPI001E50A0F3|nr:phosphonate ABC transporter, permease protein PhnE [Ruania halotolerans]UFU05389.1 phosphonate ABC transporter, permease protein PhnE [Ruania halotolerans]
MTAPAVRTVSQSDRPVKPPPSIGAILGLVAFLAITVYSAIGIEFTLTPLFTDAMRGREIVARYFDPAWSILTRPAVIDAFLETLYIAILATLVGSILALLLAMLASKVSAPTIAVYRVTKLVLSVVRSLPDVAYGLLFVAFVQTGALPGILALIVFNIGIVAKLTSESIDAVDRGPIEAVEAAGGSRFQRGRFAVMPQVAPNYLSYCFYVFELNIRASAVLGIVGAGGIGEIIDLLVSRLQHEELAAVVFALFAVVFVLDQSSRAIRRRLT